MVDKCSRREMPRWSSVTYYLPFSLPHRPPAFPFSLTQPTVPLLPSTSSHTPTSPQSRKSGILAVPFPITTKDSLPVHSFAIDFFPLATPFLFLFLSVVFFSIFFVLLPHSTCLFSFFLLPNLSKYGFLSLFLLMSFLFFLLFRFLSFISISLSHLAHLLFSVIIFPPPLFSISWFDNHLSKSSNAFANFRRTSTSSLFSHSPHISSNLNFLFFPFSLSIPLPLYHPFSPSKFLAKFPYTVSPYSILHSPLLFYLFLPPVSFCLFHTHASIHTLLSHSTQRLHFPLFLLSKLSWFHLIQLLVLFH